MFESKMSMSLENLLTIRPSGTVSKNDIGHLTMLFKRVVWSVRDAQIQPSDMDAANPNTDNAEIENLKRK